MQPAITTTHLERKIDNIFTQSKAPGSRELKLLIIALVEEEKKLHENNVLSEVVKQYANYKRPERRK